MSDQEAIESAYAVPFNDRDAKLMSDWIKLNYPALKITQVRIKQFLSNQPVKQLFFQRHIKHYFPIIAEKQFPFQRVQMDIMFIGELRFFAMIDAYTRYLIMIPIRSRAADPDIVPALETALQQIGLLRQMPPDRVDCDNEKSFHTKSFKDVLANSGIQEEDIHYANPEDHLALAFIDRVTRTIKDKLEKEQVVTGESVTNAMVEKIVNVYNNRRHTTTKEKPLEAITTYETDHQSKLKRVHPQTVSKRELAAAEPWNKGTIKIGDLVRIRKRLRVFEKGTKPKWSTEVYMVVEVTGGAFYFVRPVVKPNEAELLWTNGNIPLGPLDRGHYRKYDLLKVNGLIGSIVDTAANEVNVLAQARQEKAAAAKKRQAEARALKLLKQRLRSESISVTNTIPRQPRRSRDIPRSLRLEDELARMQ